MFRKITFALAALTALGAAALAPTSADAGWKGKHWHKHHWGHGKIYFGGPAYVAYGHGCWVKRWVDTPYGPRLRRIYVCY
ncbi:MAG: hypothetical protein KJZ73_08115 [Pseudorhodoplanes sp.]|nr:hypothetical protein [Pseudorhodoplanes sp.]MCL4711199.1 hypothetical protein [Pseudorhodoplanes sp.]MCQ3941859.1 hypothetical protein [Alphaproteobacteria bacterium]GIK79036.1 MAG: hypothetical protein BroJett024_01410 [Alphaproteobacteria bacterium]